MFTKAENYLKGKKSFALAFLAVLVGILEFVVGDITFIELFTSLEALSDPAVAKVFAGAVVAALRAGISK